MVQIKNESDYDFEDISTEEYRVYDFGDDGEITIENPEYLAVSNSGHRILDGDETSHYVPYGWKHLYWKAGKDDAHFVK